MTGIILDSILILLLLSAIGYGIKLERKLKALRDGQLAFAGAVAELNSAAGRAEAALATLRASGSETDLLHDRIMKARAVKQELEVLISRAPRGAASARIEPEPLTYEEPLELKVPASAVTPLLDDEARARRMASLMERIEGARAVMKAPSPRPAVKAPVVEEPRPSPMLQALAANQTAQQRLNRARRSLDDDMFAA